MEFQIETCNVWVFLGGNTKIVEQNLKELKAIHKAAGRGVQRLSDKTREEISANCVIDFVNRLRFTVFGELRDAIEPAVC